MRGFYTSFVVVCGGCGHRNLPHRSPREGIRLALLDQIPPCKECGKELHCTPPASRPLVQRVRRELEQAGQLVPCAC